MKALITGTLGQDGSYLAELLLFKGYEVYGIERRVALEDPALRHSRISNIIKDIKLFNGDVSIYESVLDIFNKVKPDELFHLAAQSHVGISFKDEWTIVNNNIKSTINCLNAIRNIKPECKFYHAGSSEQFGKVLETPQNENTPFNPRSPYAIGKVHSFFYSKMYREAYNIFACNGLLFNHECFDPNTPLLVKYNGIIKILMIKEIRKFRDKVRKEEWILNNENFKVYDGEEWTKIKHISTFKKNKKSKDLINRIYNTRSGIINVTNNHNLINNNGKKQRADTFKLGDKLKHTILPKSENISIVSNEEAELMGMMVADGWCDEKGKGHFSKNDKKIRDRFIYLWKKVALGYVTIRSFDRETNNYNSYGNSTIVNLNGNSYYLSYLRKQIYSKYDSFKKVPELILNSNQEVILSFLRGYNNCDGLKKNSCNYEFKNFKTNSPVLALGLIFLMHQVTRQTPTINFEMDEKYFGYYSINWLSEKYLDIEKIVKQKIREGLSQREICRQTKISRNFIRKVQNNKLITDRKKLNRHEIKKIIQHEIQPDFVYNIETESGKLMAGVGTIIVSNSPRRATEFVTRKITQAVAKIKLGKQKELLLGNLDAKRDWGYAKDFVEAMYLMLQQDKPDDYVIATGETHSIKEFLEEAFGYVDLNWQDYVKVDERFIRPAEVNLLVGDYSKAKKVLGWEPKVKFKKLVKIMMDSDLGRI